MKKMRKMSEQIMKCIAGISLNVAMSAVDTASFWGGHQPKEPHLNLKKKLTDRK